MTEAELTKRIESYKALAKTDPNIDVNALIAGALSTATLETTSNKKSYVWPILVSICLPPFGLFYAIKYLNNGDTKDRKVAIVLIIITLIGVIVTYSMLKLAYNTLSQPLPSSTELLELY